MPWLMISGGLIIGVCGCCLVENDRAFVAVLTTSCATVFLVMGVLAFLMPICVR